MALVHFAHVNPNSPAISVCIANYNGERMLVDCIESVLAQQCGEVVEIIVHDDASSDGSVALLEQRYPDVTLIVSDTNVGFCVSNNRMVDVAHGEFVLLLNNDAALLPGALSTLLQAARSGAACILTLPQFDWITGALVDRGCLLDPFYNPIPNLDVQRADVATVIGACLWIPRATWIELGGFPEWIGSIAEDMYLCCQARLRGYRVQVAQASGYRHRQGQSFGGNRISDGRLRSTYKRRALSERNKTFVLFVMTPGMAMWPLLGIHMVFLSIEGLFLAALKGDASIFSRIYWPAVNATWQRMDALLAQRKREQLFRKVSRRDYWRPATAFPRKLSLLKRHGLPGLD